MNAAAVLAGRGLTERAACRHLARLAATVPADHAIVELGAYLGRTTAWLALGSHRGHGAPILSVDPWGSLEVDDHPTYAAGMEPGYRRGDYADAFDEYLAHLAATGADRYVTPLRATAAGAGAIYTGPPVALLWHDAQHTAEAVEADLRAWLPHMAPTATIALHDACQTSYGVLEGACRALVGWDGPKVYPWRKHPSRRGRAVFRRG